MTSCIAQLGIIDCVNSGFKYKTVTPIREESTNKSLKRLQTELQENARLVDTDLVRRSHGCLGIVLTDSEHAQVPNMQPLVAPIYPTALKIPANATSIEALDLRDTHNQNKRMCLECKHAEKSLQRHM